MIVTETHTFIGGLRIENHKLCGVTTGHKPGKPEEMQTLEGEPALVETCEYCGAQRRIDTEQPTGLIQIAS